MNLKKLLPCVVIAATLASPAQAQRTAEREAQLAALQALVDDFEYSAAGPPIDDYLALEDINDDQRARAALLSGVVARTLGDNEKASRRFQLALGLSPEIRPNELYGPKIIEFFEEIRRAHPPPPSNGVGPKPTSPDGPPPSVQPATPDLSESVPQTSPPRPEEPAALANAQEDAEEEGVGALPISIAGVGAGFGAVALVALAVSAGAYAVVATPSVDPQLRTLARYAWLGGLAAGGVLALAAALAVTTTAVLVASE